MGNAGSEEKAPAAGAESQAVRKQRKAGKKEGEGGNKRLLDYYTVGEMLGQGTFGVVYACKPKGQDRECAVKMVDKVETPVDKIKEEADFLRKMNHPCVIKCYDVIYEKCFVCIVMDRLKGGDLILGMQAYWKSTGRIPFSISSRIANQMGSSVEYLHSQWMIHRDIKGDNYLTDRKDITDPECRVVLTDFGTGMQMTPNERLHEKCGTKLYWSPEFFKMDYGLKVDVWAMGVVVYGLLCGRFPFRNEQEANKKQLNFSSDTPPEAQELAQGMLAKQEDKRLSAKELMNTKFILSGRTGVAKDIAEADVKADVKDAAPSSETGEAQMKEFGADTGVKERRLELVDRLMNAGARVTKAAGNTGASKDQENHWWKDTFDIVDRKNGNATVKYEWWSEDKVASLLEDSKAEANQTRKISGTGQTGFNKASEAVVEKQLQDCGIDTKKFGVGEAKTLKQMAEEVQSGAAVLMLDATEHKKLVRVVDVILLRICAPGSTDKFLIETGEKFADGRTRNIHRLPGTKKDPHENTKMTAERIVSAMELEGCTVSLDFTNKEEFEDEDESPSYPGVCTVYRKEIVHGTLKCPAGIDPARFESTYEWSKQDAHGVTKYFRWLEQSQCDEQGIVYKVPAEEIETSALVQAPIGLNVEDLTNYLTEYKVDIAKFGEGHAKSLEDFSAELLKGESSLCHSNDGSIIRVVDVVLLKLVNSENGKVLVQASQTHGDGSVVTLNRFPGTKRRPDENQFLTARTIVQRHLKINNNHVTCSAKDVQDVEEEKPSLAYPGLRTVYRKRIVKASLSKD